MGKTDRKRVNNKAKKKQDKQLKWILVIMFAVILITALSYFISINLKKFEYGGLKFEKIMYDKLPLYYSQIPINIGGGDMINYNMYLRSDPRQLRYIKINGTTILKDYVVISLDRAAENQCSSREELRNLAELIQGTKRILKIGFNDLNLSIEKNMSYVSCDNASMIPGTILMFHSSNTTQITQKGTCYDIEFSDCKVNEVTERLMVGWIANAKGIKV